jgi:kynurenine formamidase
MRTITPDITLVDLSHPIRSGMVTYPGLPAPTFGAHLSREASRDVYANGTEFHIGRIEMVTNTGTYMDAPFHRYADGGDIASLSLERLFAVPTTLVSTSATVITADVFDGVAIDGRAVLVHTGWDQHFGQADYLGEHPYLTLDAAQRLRDSGALLVGIDSANIDGTHTGERPAHTTLLAAGIPIVEHLTHLDQLVGAEEIQLFALPAPMVGLGTFPVRAVARVTRARH